MNAITGQKVSLIAMVHVLALPGTPGNRDDIATIRRNAAEEARIYADQGFDAIIIENMHDAPYLNRSVGPEIVSTMTAVACDIANEVDIPIGIQVLAGANREALAVAMASGARFIRAEGFVFGHMADEGLMQSDAGELLRYRKAVGADNIKIAADLK